MTFKRCIAKLMPLITTDTDLIKVQINIITTLPIGHLTEGRSLCEGSPPVKDLRVIFDIMLSLRQHVAYTLKMCEISL